jgi:hypothetical protein
MSLLSSAAERLLPLSSGYASGAVAIEAALGTALSNLLSSGMDPRLRA